jgi:hypothetical protein
MLKLKILEYQFNSAKQLIMMMIVVMRVVSETTSLTAGKPQ